MKSLAVQERYIGEQKQMQNIGKASVKKATQTIILHSSTTFYKLHKSLHLFLEFTRIF